MTRRVDVSFSFWLRCQPKRNDALRANPTPRGWVSVLTTGPVELLCPEPV
jgi:hypothetical protein